MTDSTAHDYNYATFPTEDDVTYFSAFWELLKPGERAPEVELLDLAGDTRVSLTDITRQGLTVIELGSLT